VVGGQRQGPPPVELCGDGGELALDQSHAVAAQPKAQWRIGGLRQQPDGGRGLARVPGLAAVAGLDRGVERADRADVGREPLLRPADAVRGQEAGAEGAGLDDGDADAEGCQLGVQSVLTPASIATSSRRGPEVRRGPGCPGVSRG
jgi:hypothetical protein